MAQLNPNFEIDYTDINSYEQIQLINDTQLAKENLLMHKAYKEPADDAIIRNQFSSFTFVDFCPKLFVGRQAIVTQGGQQRIGPPTVEGGAGGSSLLRHYELETFSDLFSRINLWLHLNKDWRVMSMETLIFDCKTQFNQVKSSIHANYLPQNTRGLRLFLSPSKSRFAGPQTVGCINVVPRKLSGTYCNSESGNFGEPQSVRFETLDQMLARLNELILTRPIKGRILSIETITLPMLNGHVDTESNYFMDSRLNHVRQKIYCPAGACVGSAPAGSGEQHSLIDILRVYFEYGPLACSLVNMIDFVPRFYSMAAASQEAPPSHEEAGAQPEVSGAGEAACCATARPPPTASQPPKIAPTESLTRLIRRSLAWFESECNRVLEETAQPPQEEGPEPSNGKRLPMAADRMAVNLRACNLQVFHKTLAKGQLVRVTPARVHELVRTREMAHDSGTAAGQSEPLECAECKLSSWTHQPADWCEHLVELSQPHELKFVRLAYVVPVVLDERHNKTATAANLLKRYETLSSRAAISSAVLLATRPAGSGGELAAPSSGESSSSSSTSSSWSESSKSCASPDSAAAAASEVEAHEKEDGAAAADHSQAESDSNDEDDLDGKGLRAAAKCRQTQVALSIVERTNQRLRQHELEQQLTADELNDSPIGQLTYRLFAPCQLVNSSSCFAINPVNSSSPLARRGSVDLNGAGLSSENARPSQTLLGGAESTGELSTVSSSAGTGNEQQQTISFGAFFPALSTHNLLERQVVGLGASARGGGGGSGQTGGTGAAASRYTTNEFEPIDAIRRRMEIYVTTNSMKVIAGETLTVNLSDALSCLSTAIEQTVVRASFAKCAPTTWVSVYVLYAAIGELPGELLERQRSQERLAQIAEDSDEQAAQDEPDFDDDFETGRRADQVGQPDEDTENRRTTTTATSADQENGTVRVERHATCLDDDDSTTLQLYNSAYERTVALPTQPDNHLANYLEPVEMVQGSRECLWLDERELVWAQQKRLLAKKRKCAAKGRRPAERGRQQQRRKDSQCSVI